MSTSDLQVKDGQVDAIIGGEAVPPATGEFFDDIDQSTGRVIARVARCQKENVERAIAAARSALPGWKRMPVRERFVLLSKVAAGIRTDAEELARLDSLDVGKPLSQAKSDVDLAARYFEFYAGLADKTYGSTIPVDGEAFAITFRDAGEAAKLANATPYGLVSAIRTKDIDKALSMARDLECGQVYINTYALAEDVVLPFGGYKKSGFGRERASRRLCNTRS